MVYLRIMDYVCRTTITIIIINMKIQGKVGRVRFSKALWFEPLQDLRPLVIGAGGIGSWLVHFLARAGAKPVVCDMDRYDVNNIGGQLCKLNDVNKNKAIALKDLIDSMLDGEEQLFAIEQQFNENSHANPFMFCAVDNMDARKLAYQKWLELGEQRELFVDGRMGAEVIQIHTATKTKDEYMDSWFPSSEAVALPCAYKATSHIGSMTASFMVNVLTNYLADEFVPSEISYAGPTLNIDIL